MNVTEADNPADAPDTAPSPDSGGGRERRRAKRARKKAEAAVEEDTAARSEWATPTKVEKPAPAQESDQPRLRRALPGRLVYVTTFGVAAIWLLLDQATKVLAVAQLPPTGVVGAELGLVDLRLVRNPGGAFGIPGFPGLFLIVTLLVILLVVRALPSTDRLSLAAVYGLVSGGALGNVADRLLREPGFPSGHVVDFIDLGWWPVFNLADVGIVVGAVGIAVLLTIVDREERADAAARASHRSVRPATSEPPPPAEASVARPEVSEGTEAEATGDGDTPAVDTEDAAARPEDSPSKR